MAWCLWVLLGVTIYSMLGLLTYALCKVAGDDDIRRGRK